VGALRYVPQGRVPEFDDGQLQPRSRAQHESNPFTLLMSKIEFANARELELLMRPNAAHDTGRLMRLAVSSQVKMADLVNHRRAKNHV
jgi:hypothetical protein